MAIDFVGFLSSKHFVTDSKLTVVPVVNMITFVFLVEYFPGRPHYVVGGQTIKRFELLVHKFIYKSM